MKLESLKSLKFQPLQKSAMLNVRGGEATQGGSTQLTGQTVWYTSDCFEFVDNRIHFEFYNANGTIIAEWWGPDPTPPVGDPE